MAKDRKSNGDTLDDAPAAAPSHDDIARRAHEIWRARGGETGHELDDWLTAERELNEPSGEAPSPRRRSPRRERSATA
jgi:hypothetical protein